jgi:hypothetical protein
LTSAGKIVLAARREKAMREAGLNGKKVKVGSRGQAASSNGVYCAWGFTPSPLALRVVENVLAICRRGPGEGATEAADERRRLVIYACYAGTHSSILAASVHLGIVDNGTPICDLPYFDRRRTAEIGVPVFMGKDCSGAEVYALGTGWLSAPLERAVCDLIELSCPNVSVCICSVRGLLDFRARVGGFASRRCSLVFPGRNLIAGSLIRKVPQMRRAARHCLDLAAKWKDNEGQFKGEVIWFDGSKARGIGPPS